MIWHANEIPAKITNPNVYICHITAKKINLSSIKNGKSLEKLSSIEISSESK